MTELPAFFNHAVLSPLVFVVLFLLVSVVLFIRNTIRMDVVALLVILAFGVSGILTVEEVMAGFSDPNIILIALLFVVGEGLVRTGVAYQVSEWLMKVAKNSETRVLVLLMLVVAGLGSFMSSTGVVAIFIPVVLTICRQMNLSPKRLMMPLSTAGLISGMMTLIATAPNLVVNAELIRETSHRFSFFSFTPIGAVILVMGIIYMLIVRRWLADNLPPEKQVQSRYSIRDLIDSYCLEDRVKRFVVKKGSDFIGNPIEELHLRNRYGLNVLAIERWKRFRPVFLSSGLGKTEIKEKDILLVDMSDPNWDIEAFCQMHHLEPAEIRRYSFDRQSKSMGMVEIMLAPESDFIGKTLAQLQFRSRYGVNVVGIKRNNGILTGNLAEEVLKNGDFLLVTGSWKLIQAMRNQAGSFFVLDYPAEIERAVPASSQALHAVFSVAVMVILMVTDMVPNVIAALIGCLLLAKFRCIDAESAYGSIHWASLILIVGMMPFSIALQKTGGIDLIVNFMINTVGTMGKHWILISLFMLCAVIGLFISNTATAILVAPIAISLAQHLNLSPLPFAMTVAVASSSAFMTPISSPVNTMVLGQGNYTFGDFVKIGVPFTLLVMLVSVFLIPVLFPF